MLFRLSALARPMLTDAGASCTSFFSVLMVAFTSRRPASHHLSSVLPQLRCCETFIAARAPPQPHVTCERQCVREGFLGQRLGYVMPFRGRAAAWTHLCVICALCPTWTLSKPTHANVSCSWSLSWRRTSKPPPGTHARPQARNGS